MLTVKAGKFIENLPECNVDLLGLMIRLTREQLSIHLHCAVTQYTVSLRMLEQMRDNKEDFIKK